MQQPKGDDVDSVFRDLRFTLRNMGRSPGLAIVIAVSLALGIGANTAIFSLIHAVMLKSLPVQEPERLALLHWYGDAQRLPLEIGERPHEQGGRDEQDERERDLHDDEGGRPGLGRGMFRGHGARSRLLHRRQQIHAGGEDRRGERRTGSP